MGVSMNLNIQSGKLLSLENFRAFITRKEHLDALAIFRPR
jgi:hypothetical protein